MASSHLNNKSSFERYENLLQEMEDFCILLDIASTSNTEFTKPEVVSGCFRIMHDRSLSIREQLIALKQTDKSE